MSATPFVFAFSDDSGKPAQPPVRTALSAMTALATEMSSGAVDDRNLSVDQNNRLLRTLLSGARSIKCVCFFCPNARRNKKSREIRVCGAAFSLAELGGVFVLVEIREHRH